MFRLRVRFSVWCIAQNWEKIVTLSRASRYGEKAEKIAKRDFFQAQNNHRRMSEAFVTQIQLRKGNVAQKPSS